MDSVIRPVNNQAHISVLLYGSGWLFFRVLWEDTKLSILSRPAKVNGDPSKGNLTTLFLVGLGFLSLFPFLFCPGEEKIVWPTTWRRQLYTYLIYINEGVIMITSLLS